MNKKIIYGVAFLAMTQISKAQVFDPNAMYDALNAYDGNFNTAGTARYIGMGESMGALGGDISAVETNPAGLGIFRNSVGTVTMGVLSNKNNASMLHSYSNTDTNFNFSNGGFALALGDDADRLKVNLGANYSFQRLDNDVIFPYNEKYNYTIGNEKGSEDFDFESYEQYISGYKTKLKFSVAANYDDKIYFGLGLDWHYLTMDRYDTYADRMISDGSVGRFNRQGTPYFENANGFGLSVGVIGKILPEFRLGAAYHSPIWWSDINTSYNGFGTYIPKDASGNPILDALGNPVVNWDIYYGYYDRAKITAPGNMVLSAAFASNIIDENNSLGVNFDFINYFNKDYQFKGDQNYELNNSFIDSYMKNSQEYRLGVEYRYKELKLRAGYGYVSSPVKDNTVAGYNYETGLDNTTVKNYMTGEKNKLSFGIGYDIGPFFADFAYQWIKADYYTSFSGAYYNGSEIRNFGPGVYNGEWPTWYNPNPLFDTVTFGKVKNTQNNFVLTLGVRF